MHIMIVFFHQNVKHLSIYQQIIESLIRIHLWKQLSYHIFIYEKKYSVLTKEFNSKCAFGIFHYM